MEYYLVADRYILVSFSILRLRIGVRMSEIGDALQLFPHEICPVDGEVTAGNGVMDESYLTGEPFLIAKAPGSTVLSGAINGEASLTIKSTKLAVDSRYAKIMEVMRESEEKRPNMRRLADQLEARDALRHGPTNLKAAFM